MARVVKESIMRQDVFSKRDTFVRIGLLILALVCLVACGKTDGQSAPTQSVDSDPVYQPAVGNIAANGTL